MIVVIGRPVLRSSVRSGQTTETVAGTAAAIAVAAADSGARVELVGSIGDDGEGDRIVVLLGRARVGHAALIRDPAARTPVEGEERGEMPRLDGADIELGLRYLADTRVVVIAEPLSEDAMSETLTAANYHGAGVIAVVLHGGAATPELAEAATVLEAPAGAVGPFAEMVGRFAAALDSGTDAAQAFADATRDAGWESAAG